ncbi:Serine palmitoyltransferase 1 [Armadillidium nasatum]|uniref:Serine palmitoyltransferase 1 n=1 Tax=Armadillidium nasatum TaxID=96803 RepID=A0A5N5T955_9CRUS|nr:Serine palmitoyltransferase 1 [Armadillidium nasatum]
MPQQWNVYESFQALLKAGVYHLALEGILVLWIIWLLTKKPKNKNAIKLSKKEEEQLLSEWTPEPLISDPPDESHPLLHPRIVDGKIGLHVVVNDKKLLNLATHNYLNLSNRTEIEESALKCLNVYGVGSCGPRGFYGTTVEHVKLEEQIAEFYGLEYSVIYSYGFSTIASAIPAFSKNSDIIYARSKIVYFRHDDMNHLEQLLKEQEILDKKNPKKAAVTRKFIVSEGIYVNTGTICPLPELVRLRAKYKLRLFIDESCSFGTLGPRARGVCDHFGIPYKEVDLIMASLEMGGAVAGGFTVGTAFVVEHQRLSGLGYCFSASLPPMLVAASSQVFSILEKEGGGMVVKLQEVCRTVHKAFSDVCDKVKLVGDEISPVKHLVLKEHLQVREEEENLLREIVSAAEDEGVAIVMAAHLTTLTYTPPPPSIRIAVNMDLTNDQIEFASKALTRAFSHVLLHQIQVGKKEE